MRYLLAVVVLCTACSSETVSTTSPTVNPTPTTTQIPSVSILLGTYIPPRSIEIIYTDQPPTFVDIMPVGCGVTDQADQEGMSVSINERAIWETGNNADELHEHIIQHTRFVLDETRTFVVNWLSNLTLNYVLEDGFPVGSYSDITYCLETVNLTVGTHTAIIELTSLSGLPYSYSWQFRIEDATVQP